MRTLEGCAMNNETEQTLLKQEKIDAAELTKEITLLLKEHYVAKLRLSGQEIKMNFLNGQEFILALYEVQK